MFRIFTLKFQYNYFLFLKFKVTFENDWLLKFTSLLYFYKLHAAPQLCREASATYAKLVVTMQIGTMPNFMAIAHIPRETKLIRHKFHINLSMKLSRVEGTKTFMTKLYIKAWIRQQKCESEVLQGVQCRFLEQKL